MIGFAELAKTVAEVSKTSMDMPKFGEGIKSNSVVDYKDADKKLNKYNELDIEKVKCINEELASKEHPITGVKYERKIVENGEGKKVEGVFPKFESQFEAVLSTDEFKGTDSIQFNRANKQLKEAIMMDKTIADKFTLQQLEMIDYGRTPRGYTWHHSEDVGKLQLVDTKIHDQTRHTGGKKTWGGGTENR